MTEYEDSFIVNNNIDGLKPIRISLPKPPNTKLIDGFWKKREEQYFRREVYPEKLKQLEKEVKEELRAKEKDNHYVATPQRIIEEMWKVLENKYEFYEKEVKWMETQWWKRLNGHWFYNFGVPTYIDGWHWFYLNYWYMGDVKGDYPQYREADREQFLFMRYLYTTNETFKDINENTGEAIPNKDGIYEMIELSKRTFYGCIQGKNRRRGVTHVACCIGFEMITKVKGDFSFGLQSYSSDQINSAYKKIMGAWKYMPFFFKPIWKGREQPDGSIEFIAERKDDALGTRIDPAETGEGTYFDGQKLLFLLSDEEGKCLGFNELVRMYDGSIKKVQDIIIGDLLCGDDDNPRKVLSLTSGEDDMFKVNTKFGSYTCNSNHTLSLMVSDKKRFKKPLDTIIDISVKDFLKLSYFDQKSLSSFISPIIHYNENKHVIPPYLLGLWLGDGDSNRFIISKPDIEIENYIKQYCEEKKYRYYKSLYEGKCPRYHICISNENKTDERSLRHELVKLNLYKNKHIPKEYLIDSFNNRLKLLAGIIDTDGHKMANKNGYEITFKNERLFDNVIELCRSLGFSVNKRNKIATMKREDGSVYRCNVFVTHINSDNLYKIPCKIKRKISEYKEFNHSEKRKNPLKSYTRIEYIGRGKYYGFEIDGNNRFLLANGIVTHNCQNIDIQDRWGINKRTLALGEGSSIHGFTYHPSTVSEAEQGAAEQFENLCNMSNFYVRKQTGETYSGMSFLAFPAWYCMEKYVDKYGKAVVDEPTEQQKKEGFKEGARQYLLKDRESLITMNTLSSFKELRKSRKEFPFDLNDMFLRSDNSELDFNYDGISKRLIELKRQLPPPTVSFDLRWENDIKDSRVVRISNPNGRFSGSFDPEPDDQNKKVKKRMVSRITGRIEETWIPTDTNKFIIGADPYKYSNLSDSELRKKKRLLSDGGIAARFFNGRLIVTYKYRPLLLCNDLTKINEELKQNYYSYCEDLLMLAIYYGSLVFPENNIKDVCKYFRERGYSGYLLHERDANGVYKSEAGGYTNEYTKNEIFELNKGYIEQFVAVECHSDFLAEASIIKGKSDMTNQDLFTAVGYCNKGNVVLNNQQAKTKSKSNISSIFNSKYFKTTRYS